MHLSNRWMVLILVFAGLQLSACTQSAAKPAAAGKENPVSLSPLPGTDLKQLVLTEKAAQRLGIQTAPVREEQVVRKRRVGAQVVGSRTSSAVAVAPASGVVWVRVRLNESDLEKVDRGKPVLVLPLSSPALGLGLAARLAEAPPVDGPEDEAETLYYVVDSPGHGLAPGRGVLVELTLLGSGTQRKIIPYSAVAYDVEGRTWSYTSPKPLTFVRHPITVDYIDGDLAVLSEGPPPGTAVVMVGVAELLGAELGVGK